MFAVDNILISDDLVGASFCCNLSACRGACCVHGDSGAPLDPDERRDLEEVLPLVRKYLRPAALDVIEKKGVWEESSPGHYAATCVGDAECVFVRYEGPMAMCTIQDAHLRGDTDFPKPISCHLYPVRIEDLGDGEALNYEQIELCSTAVRYGRRNGIRLAEFLEEPLTRRYGSKWYQDFLAACKERRSIFEGV